MIHICFGLYDKTGRYSKFTGTTMLSMFDNHNTPPRLPSITVHILHDNTLTQDNRDKFIYLAGQYNQRVKFYNVEELCADKLAIFLRLIPFMKSARTSIGTFYKFFIMYVLESNIEKVIYLDADIVVNLDINELWQIELDDKPLGAVPVFLQDRDQAAGLRRMENGFDLIGLGIVKREDYFNAGVLLMNLKRLRNEEAKILDGMKFRGEHPEFIMFDQCIWNYCFSTQYLKLPTKFNREVMIVRSQEKGIVENKIYHYTGSNARWSFGLNMKDGLNRLWMKYFMMTPWFDLSAIDNLYEGVQDVLDNLKQTIRELSTKMKDKTRVFITFSDYVDMITETFSPTVDDEIIIIQSKITYQNLFDEMLPSRGKKIFFIILPAFPCKKLTEKGFVQNKDFVNGFEFLPEARIPLDSYPFIQKM